jgi:hypothetical protein
MPDLFAGLPSCSGSRDPETGELRSLPFPLSLLPAAAQCQAASSRVIASRRGCPSARPPKHRVAAAARKRNAPSSLSTTAGPHDVNSKRYRTRHSARTHVSSASRTEPQHRRLPRRHHRHNHHRPPPPLPAAAARPPRSATASRLPRRRRPSVGSVKRRATQASRPSPRRPRSGRRRRGPRPGTRRCPAAAAHQRRAARRRRLLPSALGRAPSVPAQAPHRRRRHGQHLRQRDSRAQMTFDDFRRNQALPLDRCDTKGKLSGSVTPAIRSNFGETGLSASKLATRRAV